MCVNLMSDRFSNALKSNLYVHSKLKKKKMLLCYLLVKQ